MQIILIMRIMAPKKCILFQLLPRLLNNYQKPKSYRLCFSDTFLRLNYNTSVNGMNFCRQQHRNYKNTFKKLKFDMNNDILNMLGEIFETDDKKFERALLHQKHLEKCSEEHLRDMALYLRGLNFTAEHITLSPWILSLTKSRCY
ncbi:hypothetical protein Avbf_03617 [Armadillidium vulgare]|nr:hypothetical protein Avbf_03617 [Armadillidium vulgare]